MSIIIDDLQVVLEDRIGKVEFNTDFRISMLFEMLMQDKSIDNKEKVSKALNLYYPNMKQITDFEKAIEDMLWFYRCGKEELANSNKNKSNNSNKSNSQIYSYEFDDSHIYSAFLQQYNIDLQDIEYLHWWKFKALFDGLSKDTKIVEIMGYRAIDISKIKDKEEKARYKKLKRIYALPDMRTAEEKEVDFGRAFW